MFGDCLCLLGVFFFFFFLSLGAHLASSQEGIDLLRLYFFPKQMEMNFLQFQLQQVTSRPITRVKIYLLY